MNPTRTAHLAELMKRNRYQVLICRLPQHVVMLTGYAPVLGNSFCMVSLRNGSPEIRLAIPQQEEELLPPGAAVEIRTFSEETMDYIGTCIQVARKPLQELFHSAGLTSGLGVTGGYEGVYSPVAPVYTQVGVPGPATLELLSAALPGAQWRNATNIFDELSEIKTEEDLNQIRRSEQVAIQGFQAAREAVRVGATEADVAAATSMALIRAGYAQPGARLVLPHVHVMAGPRAAEAHKAFNLTSNAAIQHGDTVMVQIELGLDGYWAELTRTFFAAEISNQWRRAHQACVAAQEAALKLIRDGTSGREADAAARTVLYEAGFGEAFKHGLGHGCGFQAINHADAPILHPASESVLRMGMVHNIEPAVYLDGKGGFRLNDNVAVQQDSYELLSAALPRDLDWLVTG